MEEVRRAERPGVIVAVHGYPPTFGGGAERRAERTARGLLKRGYRVAVLCVESAATSRPGAPWEDTTQDGVLVRRLSFDARAARDRFRMSYANPLVKTALQDLIQAWHPSLVHLFSGYLLTASVIHAARAANLPTIVTLTDYWWLCHQITLIRTDGSRCDGPSIPACTRCHAETFRRYRLTAQQWPEGAAAFWKLAERSPTLGRMVGATQQRQRRATLLAALGQTDALIAPSQYLARYYLHAGVDAAKLRVWRQGVDARGALPRRPSDTLRFGYLGQIKSHKGIDVLLAAWGRLRGTRPRQLVLYGSDVGEAEYGQRIRQSIAEIEGVTWPGEFGAGGPWAALSDMDVLVVPSRWAENSPNSILEARAAHVPVVGSDLGGVAEMVKHDEDGLLFQVDDPADLARQLQRLLDEPALAERLRERTPPVQSVDDEIDQICTLYQEILERHGTVAQLALDGAP
ncbi:MAG: glycosyltransferase family 4 protein [Chloroflexota bacterium]